MFKLLSKPFRGPTIYETAEAELQDSQRQLLQFESAADYNRKMAEFHQDKIDRLTKFLWGK